MSIATYTTIRVPLKEGVDVTSELQRSLRSAFIAMAGGSEYKDLTGEEREALGWLYTSSEY